VEERRFTVSLKETRWEKLIQKYIERKKDNSQTSLSSRKE